MVDQDDILFENSSGAGKEGNGKQLGPSEDSKKTQAKGASPPPQIHKHHHPRHHLPIHPHTHHIIRYIIAALVILTIATLVFNINRFTDSLSSFAGPCAKLEAEEKDRCREEQLLPAYLGKNDPSLCENLFYLKHQCLDELREKNKGTTSDAIKQALLSDDKEHCGLAADKEFCEASYHENKAQETEDVTLCENIEDEERAEKCKNRFHLAKAKTGVSECEQITVQTFKEECQLTKVMAKVNENNNPKHCDDIPAVSEKCKETYYTNKALSKDDVSHCNLLADSSKCTERFYRAKAFRDPSYCNKLVNPQVVDTCTGG